MKQFIERKYCVTLYAIKILIYRCRYVKNASFKINNKMRKWQNCQ